MNDLSNKVKDLLNQASKKDMYFLGRRPSLNEIYKSLLNFELYEKQEILEKKRINMGEIYLLNEEVLGYNLFTIMQNANPTPYERKFLDMGNGLNYFYLKKLFVHPEHRNKGIGTKLIENNLNLAKKLNKHLIMDVEKNNYKMANILLQKEFQEDFNWTSPRGFEMMRFFHE